MSRCPDLHAVVLADLDYALAALVTAKIIRRFECKVTLLFISRGQFAGEELSIEPRLLQECDEVGINLIKVKDELPAFNFHHFNSSIIYKLLVPLALPSAESVVIFDAGIIPGLYFEDYLIDIQRTVEFLQMESLPLACYIHPRNSNADPAVLSAAIANGWTDEAYPSGGCLVINCQIFRAGYTNEIFNRFIDFQNKLMYADQELIMLSMRRDSVVNISSDFEVRPIFLSLDFESWVPWSKYDLARCAWWKICGTVKPWKYWAIDPNKTLWISEARKVISLEAWSSFDAIRSSRWGGGERWLAPSLERFDSHLDKVFNPSEGRADVR